MVYNKQQGCIKNRESNISSDCKCMNSMNFKLEFFDWYEFFFKRDADLTKLYYLCLFHAYVAGRSKNKNSV